MAQPDQDKTENATPYRLQEARKRGEVAKSQDVTGGLVMIVAAAIIALTGGGVALALANAARQTIEWAGTAPALDRAFVNWASYAYAPVWQSLVPLVLGLVVIGVVANLVQTGPMFTTHPLKPDFSRMNPAQTFKRVFSMRTIWELGKLFVKAVLLAGVCALFVLKAQSLAEAVALTLPQRVGALAMAAFVKTSVYVLLVLGLVALVDLLFTRREFMRRMRMSRRELRDEVKRRDGDPAVKAKQKQQIRDLLKKTRALSRVQDADVVITNPTHVAVALRYRNGQMLAPVVLAKGAGFLSARIRKLAVRHGVPIVRVPALARAIYGECDIDGAVPETHYAQLAPVYRGIWARQAEARA
ncbi:MAG: EscU/YscU/HrcU family type III secretion system export apparatus switch protein [Pseudomonadota bacterium]|nr:EscU/YscU/HrcU family type III secretion system export apparatus switch protein [Pseudomonadota bacterium]